MKQLWNKERREQGVGETERVGVRVRVFVCASVCLCE